MALNEHSASSQEPSEKISVQDLSKSYESTQALEAVSLSISEGEFCCIVGPSGCGKTTLLRAIAGLETLDSGSVLIDGEPIMCEFKIRPVFHSVWNETNFFLI